MSKIEWTDLTINPFGGCSHISPGCKNCYAERMVWRMMQMGNPKYSMVLSGDKWNGKVFYDPSVLNALEKIKKPCRVFVGSMCDPFHENMQYSDIFDLLHKLSHYPQHTFQLLTKRPENAKYVFDSAVSLIGKLENVWLGVSVESQDYVSRIEILLEIPAAVRFVSLEPLLGPVDIEKYLIDCSGCGNKGSAAYAGRGNQLCLACKKGAEGPGLDWVIVGGENGPGARPMDLDWARSIRDQCHKACVPFFFKGMGGTKKKENNMLLDRKRWEQFPEMRK